MHTHFAHRIGTCQTVERIFKGFRKSTSKLFSGLLKALFILAFVAALAACKGGNGDPVYSYSVGGTVSDLAGSGFVLLNNSGDDLSISSNGTFTFSKKLTSGNEYSVTISAYPSNPSQICTVSNASGTISGENVTNIVVACRTIYAVGGTVSGLTGSGLVLKKNGGDDLSVSANGTFAFATKLYDSDAYAVTVGTQPSNQRCTVNSGSGTISGADVTHVVVECVTPRFAYVIVSGDQTVLQYTIGTDGSLSPMSPASVGAGFFPTSIAVDLSGKHAYVTNFIDGTVSQYNIGTDGKLTAMSTPTVATSTWPSSIAVDPSGKHAYVLSQSSGAPISQYNIGTDGSLTPMSASVSATAFTILVAPSGRYVYIPDSGSARVKQYTVGIDGSLAAMSTPTVAAGSEPISIAVDSSEKYAYVVNRSSNNISQYTIGTDGSLTPMSTPTVATGSGPISIALDPSGKYAYVANQGDKNITQYTIGTDGSLSPMSTASVSTGSPTGYVAVDPSGNYVYVSNGTAGGSFVSQYRIGTDGSLIAMSTPTLATASSPGCIAIVGYK